VGHAHHFYGCGERLDQEQPNQQFFATLGQAVTSGQVPQSRLDNMVHRILRAMYEVGIFDNPQKIQAIPLPPMPRSRRTSRNRALCC